MLALAVTGLLRVVMNQRLGIYRAIYGEYNNLGEMGAESGLSTHTKRSSLGICLEVYVTGYYKQL